MEQPSHFDRLAGRATAHVGRPWFFVAALVAIAAWVPTLFLWDTGPSDLLVDSLTNPASLLLLILLQNSQNRGSEAKDQRQDEMEHALADILRHLAQSIDDDEARDRLTQRAERLGRNAAATDTMSSAGFSHSAID